MARIAEKQHLVALAPHQQCLAGATGHHRGLHQGEQRLARIDQQNDGAHGLIALEQGRYQCQMRVGIGFAQSGVGQRWLMAVPCFVDERPQIGIQIGGSRRRMQPNPKRLINHQIVTIAMLAFQGLQIGIQIGYGSRWGLAQQPTPHRIHQWRIDLQHGGVAQTLAAPARNLLRLEANDA